MKSTQKNEMYMVQCKKFAFGTQGKLYSTELRLGFAFGVMHILGLASGVKQIFAFLDTNMSVTQTQNSGIGDLGQRENCALQWNIGFPLSKGFDPLLIFNSINSVLVQQNTDVLHKAAMYKDKKYLIAHGTADGKKIYMVYIHYTLRTLSQAQLLFMYEYIWRA